MSEKTPVEFEITTFESSSGALTKTLGLDKDGTIQTLEYVDFMSAGTARRTKFNNLQSFGEYIDNFGPYQAFTSGSIRSGLPDTCRVTTLNKLE